MPRVTLERTFQDGKVIAAAIVIEGETEGEIPAVAAAINTAIPSKAGTKTMLLKPNDEFAVRAKIVLKEDLEPTEIARINAALNKMAIAAMGEDTFTIGPTSEAALLPKPPPKSFTKPLSEAAAAAEPGMLQLMTGTGVRGAFKGAMAVDKSYKLVINFGKDLEALPFKDEIISFVTAMLKDQSLAGIKSIKPGLAPDPNKPSIIFDAENKEALEAQLKSMERLLHAKIQQLKARATATTSASSAPPPPSATS